MSLFLPVHRLRQGLAGTHILEFAMGDMATLAALLLSAINEISASPSELKDLKLLPSDKFELEQPKCWATSPYVYVLISRVSTRALLLLLYICGNSINNNQSCPMVRKPKAKSRKPKAMG